MERLYLCAWSGIHRKGMIWVLPMQDFISDVQGIGKPFAWVGGRLSGLLPTSDPVSQPAELPEQTRMDLDAGVEQTGAAIGEAQQVMLYLLLIMAKAAAWYPYSAL